MSSIINAILPTLVFVFVVGIFYYRIAHAYSEKPSDAPQRTSHARLVNRQVVQKGSQRTGRSQGMGYNFLLTFRTDEGEQVELYSYDYEFGALREGDQGTLTWKGPYFQSFLRDAA